MKISLITPASKRSVYGNWTTAARWTQILRRLGHRVDVGERYDGAGADAMIAIHAWRSADSIADFADRYPKRPLIVCLAGTDIYRFQHSHPDATLGSMARADRLVGLHELVAADIPARFRAKLDVIYQSAPPLPKSVAPSRRSFDVCVVGRMRAEKDPLRTAHAARSMPPHSRLRVLHLGAAEDEWATSVPRELVENHRYRWLGEMRHWQVRRVMRRARLMVISSRMEGGANVVSEAIAGGLPVIASNIPGNAGLLGEDYDGFFPVGDTAALAGLLDRAECEPGFLPRLHRQCAVRSPLFHPAREATSWRRLLAGLAGSSAIA